MELKPLFDHIVDAIHEKDGAGDGIAARDFPDRIRAIPTGWTDIPTPEEVYRINRPADWLPMPVPADNEMFLLLLVPEGSSSQVAFTVTCSGSYTVETGTVQDGVFVPSSHTGKNSGQAFEAELAAKDFQTPVTEGRRQVMMRVSGTDIQTWSPSKYGGKTSSYVWPIVEIRCRLPSGTSVRCGDGDWAYSLNQLRYFSWEGNNQMTSMLNMFNRCSSLETVLHLDTSQVTDMEAAFMSCYSMEAFPPLDTSQVTNMKNAFSYCTSIKIFPPLDTGKVTDMGSMFETCYSLRSLPPLDMSQAVNAQSMMYLCVSLKHVPNLDTSRVTNVMSMFSGCAALRSVPELDLSRVEKINKMFMNCYSLAEIPRLKVGGSSIDTSSAFSNTYSLNRVLLDPTVEGWSGAALSFKGCSLGHDAIVDLFNSLPVITSGNILTLTGNPGVSALTAEEKAVAAGKNWTLTL